MNKGIIYVGASLIALALVGTYVQNFSSQPKIDPNNKDMVEMGKPLYYAHCASCHGKKREGETANWRSMKEDGTLPAPPHDETGHTWHHDDQLLFDYTKKGGQALAPDGFKSAMPPFKETLSDTEIRAVLAFIKSRWPKEIQERQQQMNDARK